MNTKKIEFKIENECTVRDFLKEQLSKKMYKSLRSNGRILLNGQDVLRHITAYPNDIITVLYQENKSEEDWPEYSVLPNIIYEDENYLICYKPNKLLTIPTKSEPMSLYQSILYYYKVNNIDASISFINRLDKETQGLVLVAKNRLTAYTFNNNKEQIDRKYYALVKGHLKVKKDTIQTYIAKGEHKRFVSDSGKLAISEYQVIEEYEDTTLVEFHLLTGRTHQIRVHCNYLNTSIVGDSIYGDGDGDIMKLCSYYLKFNDPVTNEEKCFKIKPEWM